MKTKTAYRTPKIPQPDRPEPNIPAVEIDGQKAEPVVTLAADIPAGEENEALREYEKEIVEADEAALALQKQIDALRRSEELARQHQVQAAQRQPTREQILAAWKQQGLSDAEARFLEENPAMIDNAGLTAFASGQAAQRGHERGSEEYLRATREIFNQHLAHLQQAAATNAAPQPTPAFFKPPPARPRAASNASIVSAPVSREVPDGTVRSEPANDPSRVKLTAEEVEAARLSGVSLREYAEGKLRLAREKRDGLRQ